MAYIHHTKLDNYISIIELDNPPANTLSKSMKEQFEALITSLEKNAQLRVLIITGKNDKFCSGDDLKEAAQNLSKKGGIAENLLAFNSVINRFESLEIPIIAAINGWCIGGGLELALCCDIRIAIPEAKFISAGVNVGLTASAYRLPRLIGIARAKRMLLTGAKIDANQALEYGLITDIFPKESLITEAINLAKIIASKAPLAVKATKKIANSSLDLDKPSSKLFQQKELELLSNSEDHKRALQAFLIKDKPVFFGN